MLKIFLLHQIVQTGVLVASAIRVTLAKAKDFVDTVGCSLLCDDELACFGAHLLQVGGIDQFAVLSVAGTLFWVRTSIRARTKTTPLHFEDIPLYVRIHRDILVNILHKNNKDTVS